MSETSSACSMNILEPSTDPRETVLQCHITRFTPQGVDDLTTTTETVLDPAESTIVNTGPSREDIHKSGLVDCIEGGGQVEQC